MPETSTEHPPLDGARGDVERHHPVRRRGGVDAARRQPHHPRPSTPAPASAPRGGGVLRARRHGERVHGDAVHDAGVHVPGPRSALQAHPLRAPPRSRPLPRRGLRLEADAAPVPGRAACRHPHVPGRACRRACQGEVPPALVAPAGSQGRRRPAGGFVEEAVRKRVLPGVPRRDGAGIAGRRACHRRAAVGPDMQDVPERGARRVLRAVEAQPRAAGGDVRRVPLAVEAAEPGAGEGAVHEPRRLHERRRRRRDDAERRRRAVRRVVVGVPLKFVRLVVR